MSCTHLSRNARPAPLWRRLICPHCRKNRRADSLISFALACRKADSIPTAPLARTLAALNLPYSVARPRRERIRSLTRRAKPFTAVAILGALAAGYGWTHYIDIDPGISVPTPSIQGRNAYDDLQRAIGLLRNEDVIGELTGAKPIVGSTSPKFKVRTASGEELVYSLESIEQQLALNRSALDAIRAGIGREYLAPPARSFSQTFPEYAKYRSMARLLIVDSRAAAARKQWFKAISSALDAIDLGVTIQQKGPILAKLVGLACEAIGNRAAWPLIDRLSATEARACVARMSGISARRFSFAQTLEEEKWSLVAGLQEIMQKPGWRGSLLRSFSVSDEESRSVWQSWAAYVRLLPYTKSRILDNTVRHMDLQIAAANGPFNPLPRSADLPEEEPFDLINSIIMPVYIGGPFKEFLMRTQNALLATALDLQAYRADHGRYPATLTSSLRSNHIDHFVDPFSFHYRNIILGMEQGTKLPNFRYRELKDGYLLYSVGPDGIDNVGTPIVTRVNADQRATNLVMAESQGDIVAGINTPGSDD